jgi:hypothetical protein
MRDLCKAKKAKRYVAFSSNPQSMDSIVLITILIDIEQEAPVNNNQNG